MNRPHGEIDILIGANYSELLPRVIQTNKNLQLQENQFGLSVGTMRLLVQLTK